MIILAGANLNSARVYKSLNLELECKVGQQLYNKVSTNMKSWSRFTTGNQTFACLISPSALSPSPG